MKYLIWLLLSLCCFGQEVLRPTTDIDPGSVAGINCLGTTIASTAMPKAYDLAGLSTFSAETTFGSTSQAQQQLRFFKSWQTTHNTYTGLTLNINSSSDGWNAFSSGVLGGKAKLFYSLNGGTSWTLLLSDTDGTGWNRQTSIIPISTNQVLSQLYVATCTAGFKGAAGNPPGGDDVNIWDIWTSGTLPAPIVGNGSGSGLASRAIVVVN